MFGLNENTQYYVCQRYVRMNTGINGLYQIVRTEMELPPLGGAVFIFFSKNRQQVKLLKWDGDGFLLYHKRLERGTFELPFFDPKNKQCKMPHKTLSAIMSGICLKVSGSAFILSIVQSRALIKGETQASLEVESQLV